MELFKYKVRFKEKTRLDDGEDDEPDWETREGWSETIEASNIRAVLDEGARRCAKYEREAARDGWEIKVSCEVEVSNPRAFR